jgi:hypothetical protein
VRRKGCGRGEMRKRLHARNAHEWRCTKHGWPPLSATLAEERPPSQLPWPWSIIMDLLGLDGFANATGRLAAVLPALNHKKC